MLSVVVCTRNRVGSLKRCVDALFAVTTTRDWELVIVDNDSDDGTSQYLASLKPNQLVRPRVITTFEPKRGTGAAKNKGWRTANADIVAFTDDDCYVSKDYVDSVLQIFEDDSGVGFLGGRILLFDARDYKITIQESPHKCFLKPLAFVATGTVQGANMAFRRTTLERIGGFDERMGAGTKYFCEDIDAAAAALWAGVPGVYDPRPVVYHHHGRRTKRAVTELRRGYDEGRGAYYAKYILNKTSRSKYIRAWMKSIREECRESLIRGRLPTMGRSLRELSGGLRFALQECKTTNKGEAS